MKADESQPALRAILFADAVAYSRHVQADEQATLDFMQRCFSVFRELAAAHGGEVLKTMGDGAMVDFGSATEAVLFALAAQDKLAGLAEGLPSDHRIRFRIGIHLGEVRHREGDVYGHIVNVASRLEHLAEPGGICISHAVFDQVRQSVPAIYGSLGRRALRNIPHPVVAYRVHPHLNAAGRAEASASEISVSLIERLSLSDPEGNELTPKSIKAQALVGYLVLSHHHKEIKDRILGLLWSDKDLKHARQEYRSVVRQVQQAFHKAGSEAFQSHPNDVAVVLSTLQVDLLRMSNELDEGSVAPELVEGRVSPDHILAGLERADQVFYAWLKVTRHRWRDRLVEQLETCLDRFAGEHLQSKHAAIALLAIDSTHEPAARMLMQVYMAEGKSAAALRIYRSLRDVLAKDFGIAPSAETQNAAKLVRSGHGLGSPKGLPMPHRPAVEGRLPVIDVRPFLAPDGKVAKAHLLWGLRAEVIACLTKFRDWVIIEEHTDKGAPERERGPAVDYRLEAHANSAFGNEIVSLMLVDAANDRVVWSERYPISLQEWGRVSGIIARKTAAVLDIYLSAERVSGHSRRRDLSLEAYDDWLRGENLLTLWQVDAEIEAERLFRSVIARMPAFAPAYSSMASIYNSRHLIIAGFRRDPKLEAEALKLAQKAVQLDPLETRAHLTLAWSYLLAARYEQADIHYDLAFELNPSNPKTLISCAHGIAYTGRGQRAEELAQLALGLTPIVAPYQWAYVAGIRFICGDYPGSVAAATMGTGSLIDVLAWKAAALAHSGEIAASRSAAREFLDNVRAQWAGEPPDDAAIANWLLHGLPIKGPHLRDRLSEGLRLAGVVLG